MVRIASGLVMRVLVPRIHVFKKWRKTWMAETSPAMTIETLRKV